MKKSWLLGLGLLTIVAFITNCGSDPCADVACVFGECVDGTCDCEIGYEGPKCDKESVPQYVSVKKITVNKFPEKRTGDRFWDDDDDSGADLVVKVSDNRKVYHENKDIIDVAENADPTKPHVFETDFKVEKMQNTLTFELLDYDVDGDTYEVTYQFMYSFKETLENLIVGFPSKLTLSNDKAEIVLDVSYKF